MKYFVTVLYILATTLAAQNLIQNPGLETWSGGMPDHWDKDDSIFIYQEDVIVHAGNFSARDSLISQAQTYADFFQGNFPIQDNTQYVFTIWVYDNDPAGRVRPGIYWHPSGSSWCPDYSVDSTGWQELSFTVTSPNSTDSALVLIRAYDIDANWDGDAIFYLDDISFVATAAQPPVINRVWHDPINPGPAIMVNAYAKVSDDGSIASDTLFYGINNLNSPTKISHIYANNDTFNFQIPGQIAGDTIFYYTQFIDNDGLDVVSDTHSYYTGETGIYINEILYDTYSSDSACFIELYGPGSASLDDFSIVGINGNDGSMYAFIDLIGQTIPGNGFFVIAQDSTVANYDMVTSDADMQNGPDNIELRLSNVVVDALGYGTLNGWVFTGEWLPAPDVEYDHLLGRYTDGADTDNNYVDFYDYITPTPGEPNPPTNIFEHKVAVSKQFFFENPVRAGVVFSSFIQDKNLYPLSVYNAAGQLVIRITDPSRTMDLPTGVYFLQLKDIRIGSIKLVIIK